MSNNEESILFKPFLSEKLTLTNKIVMAPMSRMKAFNNIPTQQMAEYYKRRVDGGVGLIITECTFVDHPVANGFIDAPAFFGKEALSGWKYIVDEVHKAGGKIIPQIWHAGASHKEIDKVNLSIGPIDIFEDGKRVVKGMDQNDIDDVIKAFTKAAKDAKSIGFDGVEIHGAHSYLIDQFIWEGTNKREDKYGGSVKNRIRLAVEIIQSIREEVGENFPIIFRFSQWKLSDYDAQIAKNPKELEEMLIPLVEAGVDIFHVSTRRFWEAAFDSSPLTLASWTKKITGKPVIAVGSVGIDKAFDIDIFLQQIESTPSSVQLVEEKLKLEEFDLIAVGRALIADPNWANKIKAGDLDKVNPFSSKSLETLN